MLSLTSVVNLTMPHMDTMVAAVLCNGHFM